MDPRIERSSRPQPTQETQTEAPKPAVQKAKASGPKVTAGTRELVGRHSSSRPTSIFVLKAEKLETVAKPAEAKRAEVKPTELEPMSSEQAIAVALRAQTKQEIRTRPPPVPRPAAAPRPSTTTRQNAPAEDCASKAVNATTVCTGAVAAAAAGTATGPVDLVIVGVGGAACGLAYLDYYSCETKAGR